MGDDVGDVAGPHAIWRFGREVSAQQVRGHRQAVLAVGGEHEFPLAPGPDAVQLHQALHPVFAHPHAPEQELPPYPGPAVLALELGVDRTDVRHQRRVADALGASPHGQRRPRLDAALPVLEKNAHAHPQHQTHQAHWPHRLELVDPGVLHSDSFAKYAVAFFQCAELQTAVVLRRLVELHSTQRIDMSRS